MLMFAVNSTSDGAMISRAITVSNMGKKRKELAAWQREDARRLRALWDAKLPMSQEDFADLHLGGKSQGAAAQYLNGAIPLNHRAVTAFAKVLETEVSAISPTLAAEIAALKAGEPYYKGQSEQWELTRLERRLILTLRRAKHSPDLRRVADHLIKGILALEPPQRPAKEPRGGTVVIDKSLQHKKRNNGPHHSDSSAAAAKSRSGKRTADSSQQGTGRKY